MTVRKNALMGKRIVVAALTVAALAAPCALVGCGGETPAEHKIVPLPPRYDFFEKHPSQVKGK